MIHLINNDARHIQAAPEGPYAVITDPVWPNYPEGMFELDTTPQDLLAKTLGNYLTAKRIIIILRADSDPRFLDAVPASFPFFRAIYLPYAIPGYIGRKLGGMELAYWFGEPVVSAEGRRVIPGEAPRAQHGGTCKDHPCSRNIDHVRWLVHWGSDTGETVVDPFMGSGTTGIACVEMERDFVGIEIDKKHYNTAKSRIEDAQSQLRIPLCR